MAEDMLSDDPIIRLFSSRQWISNYYPIGIYFYV